MSCGIFNYNIKLLNFEAPYRQLRSFALKFNIFVTHAIYMQTILDVTLIDM